MLSKQNTRFYWHFYYFYPKPLTLVYKKTSNKPVISNLVKLAVLLSYQTIFLYTEACSFYYDPLRAGLKKRGCFIGANDLFIAGHAKCQQKP